MDIVFGLWADSGSFPGHGGEGEGALGVPVVGPNGLLEILETARGLGAPATANVVRIAAFQAALEGMEGPPRFWSRSLEVDGWATARHALDEDALYQATGALAGDARKALVALGRTQPLPQSHSRAARHGADYCR